MDPVEELKALIEQQLNNVCETNLPRLCEMCKTAEGRETATEMIYEYCINNGVAVQTAMAHIDGEI